MWDDGRLGGTLVQEVFSEANERASIALRGAKWKDNYIDIKEGSITVYRRAFRMLVETFSAPGIQHLRQTISADVKRQK